MDKAPIATAESTSLNAASKEASPELQTTFNATQGNATQPKLQLTTQNKVVEGNHEDLANKADAESGDEKTGLCCPWFGDMSCKKKEKKVKKGMKNEKALWNLEKNVVDGNDSNDPVSKNVN